MSKRWIVLLLTIGLLLGLALSARTSNCAWCPTSKCYNEFGCGISDDCYCLKQGGDIAGRCVSLEKHP
jgi:hypothetical protein